MRHLRAITRSSNVTTMIETDEEKRLKTADKIKSLKDVSFRLRYWNYGPCAQHSEPKVDCEYRACGGDLFAHQRVGTAWLYAVQKGLLADDTGVGKTSQLLALVALLKEKDELRRRAIVISNTPAVGQWRAEAARWIPDIRTIYVDSTMHKRRRIAQYASDWELLIIGSHLLISDKEVLEHLRPFDLVITDDVDPLLSHNNITHRTIRAMAEGATRSFTVNATPLQIRLQQLHAAFVPIGGYDIFGSLRRFESRHIKTELVHELSADRRAQSHRKQTGYKNMGELRNKIESRYLRRKATELSDIKMPILMPPHTVWLEMSQPQRLRYQELQAGVLRIIQDEGEKVKNTTALTQFLWGNQICAGLQSFNEPDVPGASPKLDWLFEHLEHQWNDRKTIVFIRNIGMVRAALERVDRLDFNAAVIWGQNQSAKSREEQKDKFWNDPNCRVLFGTTSLERSHNLQCASNVVMVDTQLNPARVMQLMGRAKRAASPHDRVFTFQLMMHDSQESRYNKILSERAAVADFVFNDDNDFFEKLTPMELLRLVSP